MCQLDNWIVGLVGWNLDNTNNLKLIIKTKLLASPDRSGILFPAPLAGKRYSGWQERLVLKKLKYSASEKTKDIKKAPTFRLMLLY